MMNGVEAIPQSLIISGHQVSIQVMRLDEAKGEAYSDKLSINLEEDLPFSLQLETLIHEALHIGDEFYQIFDEGKAERQINQISNFFYQLLTQNQELAQTFLPFGEE